MEMIKIVKGTEKEVMELQANLFARIPVVAEDGSVPHQVMGSP